MKKRLSLFFADHFSLCGMTFRPATSIICLCLICCHFASPWLAPVQAADPHAQELMDSQGRLGASIVQRADRAYLERLVSVLEGARELDPMRAGLSVASAAKLLLRAASGSAYDATSPATHAKHLAEIVRVIVVAMRRP